MINREKEILLRLAEKKVELCGKKENLEKKKLLKSINELNPLRPAILVFPEGSWKELIPDFSLECEDKQLREWEYTLKAEIYTMEVIKDDKAFEPYLNIPWDVKKGNFGFDVEYTHGDNGGSYVWDAPLKDLEKDFAKLKFRELSVERNSTFKKIETAKSIFGNLLPTRIRGQYWWTLGMTWEVIRLIGLENLMLYMYDQPENLNRLMKFLMEEHINYVDWFEKQGLLTPVNEDDYVGSGGVAYTDELPQKDWHEGDRVRLKDIWTLSESQETVGVGPEMFNEFILKYQSPVTNKFGLVCYGCCEGLHLRIDSIMKAMPNLRRVSVSPWADQEIMAAKLGKKYIFSRKPNPAAIAVQFKEEAVREDLRTTLKIAGKLPLEIIMKDLHTIQSDPTRITRWVKIAREEIDKLQR